MPSRADLQAEVLLLRQELERERRLRAPACPNELVLLRRQVTDLQALVHLSPAKLKVYTAMLEATRGDSPRLVRLRRRLQRLVHPDRAHKYKSVAEVLARLSAAVNAELSD